MSFVFGFLIVLSILGIGMKAYKLLNIIAIISFGIAILQYLYFNNVEEAILHTFLALSIETTVNHLLIKEIKDRGIIEK